MNDRYKYSVKIEMRLSGQPSLNVTASIQLANRPDAFVTSYGDVTDRVFVKRLKLVVQWSHHPGSFPYRLALNI